MAPKNREILVVDDDEDTIIFLKKILSTAGFSVTSACTKLEAIKSIDERSPHLVILDVKLGTENGLKVLQYMRNSNYYRTIPVVVVSADSSRKAVTTAMATGATDFLAKPLVTNKIIQKARKLTKDTELPTFVFTESEEVKVEIEGSITKINELSCYLDSPVKFPEKVHVDLFSEFLVKMKADQCKLKVPRESKIINSGQYLTELNFQGMNEKTAQIIRKQKATKRS